MELPIYPLIQLQQHSDPDPPTNTTQNLLSNWRLWLDNNNNNNNISTLGPPTNLRLIGIGQQPQVSLLTRDCTTTLWSPETTAFQSSPAIAIPCNHKSSSIHLLHSPSWAMWYIHSGTREVLTQSNNFSSQKNADKILAHNKGEGKAGKAAVHGAMCVLSDWCDVPEHCCYPTCDEDAGNQ